MWQYNHNYQTELYHYGTPGMKWGVRKERVPSEEATSLKKTRQKKMSERTNDDLKKAKERMQLETDYYTYNDKTAKGKRALATFLAVGGTLAAVSTAIGQYAKFGKMAANGIGKSFKAARVIRNMNKRGDIKFLINSARGRTDSPFPEFAKTKKMPLDKVARAASNLFRAGMKNPRT